MGGVAQLWRHPIKAHGREALAAVTLTAGQTMPCDRTWAVAHEHATADGTAWAPCSQFSNGARAPGLMAIEARLDEATRTVHLTHPDLPPLSLCPDDAPQALIEWARPLTPEGRAAPARVVRARGHGMTDTGFPSVSLGNLSSLRAVSQRLGRDLSVHRWRMNIWLDGLAPWEEFDWIGRRLRIGEAVLEVVERVGRCRATEANPETGRRDAATLQCLEEGWSHRDFGVYAEVREGGRVAPGDKVNLL